MADLMRRQGGSSARNVFGDIFGFDPFRGLVSGSDALGVDMRRTDNGYEIDLPVAGFRPEEVDVSIEEGMLTIEGRSEKRRFTRSLTIPEDVDEERIEARVEHGMLTLTLPLSPRAQPRRIPVKVAGTGAGSQTAIDGSAETTST